MRNNIWTVVKKEFTRFFTDKRMVLTTLILPGLMIYFLYSFMGSSIASQFETSEDEVFTVYAENLPEQIEAMGSQMKNIEFVEASASQREEIQKNLKEEKGDCDLLAVFPETFTEDVEVYDARTRRKAPEVALYYNSTTTTSGAAYSIMQELLNAYESSMANKFDVNVGNDTYDMASEEDMAAQMFSMMVPMLMMVFLFSGCMAVAPESIAGEKERGTIATLLVTPMNRAHLALGKILSLSVIAILSGLSSFIGTMMSLPKLMGGAENMDASVYSIQDYVLLLFIILSTVLVIVAIISIVSAFAKNVKEATGWVTPIMIVSMLIGVTSMMEGMSKTEPVWFLIPLYNSVQCMNGIFSLNADITNILVTIGANICYAAIGVFALTKMFNSEKVMFSK